MRAAEELKLSTVTLNTLSDKYDGKQRRAGQLDSSDGSAGGF